SLRRSSSCFFHSLICAGAISFSRAISAAVFSPLRASKATRALNSAVRCLLFLFIVGSVGYTSDSLKPSSRFWLRFPGPLHGDRGGFARKRVAKNPSDAETGLAKVGRTVPGEPTIPPRRSFPPSAPRGKDKGAELMALTNRALVIFLAEYGIRYLNPASWSLDPVAGFNPRSYPIRLVLCARR